MITGDALAVWRAFGHRAVHVQIGSAPGRHEPGAGPMDFDVIFETLDRDGYSGWFSAEYNPTGLTQSCLDWMV